MRQIPTAIKIIIAVLSFFIINYGCNANDASNVSVNTGYSKEAIESVLAQTDSLNTFPFVAERVKAIQAALQLPKPVLPCGDTLSADQQLAQSIALSDPQFTRFLFDSISKAPYRNEIFGVYPARESDMPVLKTKYDLAKTYRVEMFNYALNNTTIALVDVQQKLMLHTYIMKDMQPDISAALTKLAIDIAAASPEVQKALGFTPGQQDALMASTKTSLNRSRCERSRHLCVAPTFVKGDKALWAIVDLTDHRLVGIRWTNVGTTGKPAPMLTEKRLQDDKVTACFCEAEQPLQKNGWNMKYMLTSSDGLRISEVAFNNKKILRSAKLVDWHVSYSGTDGFGYSDAVGCPYFSQSAVVAWEVPKMASLLDDAGKEIGFVLEQSFKSENWPQPCNYNYRQRYEFYNDGRFRIAAASLGRGCGNDGTYRPVFRIAFEGEQNNFYEYKDAAWQQWQKEQWQLQGMGTSYAAGGYQFKIGVDANNGYYFTPGNGQFKDGGRGDNSFTYVTRFNATKNEGETDLVTIGPCCNTDYKQGPEKFIEPSPDNIQNAPLVVWYVAQLKNDDARGNEYCWAESVLRNGVYTTKAYPCFCGPMFTPITVSKP